MEMLGAGFHGSYAPAFLRGYPRWPTAAATSAKATSASQARPSKSTSANATSVSIAASADDATLASTGRCVKAAASKPGKHRSSPKQKQQKGPEQLRNVWKDKKDGASAKPGKRETAAVAKEPRNPSSRNRNPNMRTVVKEPPAVIISSSMPIETLEVLQTQEPVLTPLWSTFTSSLSGIWMGVGAAFSPHTAEMEPIALSDKNEYLYDCCIRSIVKEAMQENRSIMQRKIAWVVGNPFGEQNIGEVKVQEADVEEALETHNGDGFDNDESSGILTTKDNSLEDIENEKSQAFGGALDLDAKDLSYEEIMEEDVMGQEPGLVFFEDGSYSRGPLKLLTGDFESFASPTYKIEQCLVRGGHTRLRIVHTLSVEDSGGEIQLLRIAAYKEEWMDTSANDAFSGIGENQLKLLSRERRSKPEDLIGTWKTFEISAVVVYPATEDSSIEEDVRPTYAYLSTETLKQRFLPDVPVVHFVDGDVLDMGDVNVLWLPGGVTAYVDIKQDGALAIGIGWYSDDGLHLVMEREYSEDGRLSEVRSKSEVKGGWLGGRM